MTSDRHEDPTDTPNEETLPVPPPFMFGCDQCAALLVGLAEKIRADVGCLDQQLFISRHIVEAHSDDVPAPHTRLCDICPSYAGRPDVAILWAEHRARDLFLPESIARLL
ncbi:hypothetical protein [Streptomyces sp. NPDC051452]|uniref:hypothetical protein n=1 Tax=Streptomyces sp. NPDC051452 TaxID=3365654 RepID=UPI0037A92968